MSTRFLNPGPLVVTSASRATALLMSTNTSEEIGAFISIADSTPGPGQRPPEAAFRRFPHLRLTFEDSLRESAGPSREDVARILNFSVTENAYPVEKRLLIHCYAGISRSSACALAIVAKRLGPGREAEALQVVVDACERGPPLPNDLLVEHADALLGRGGDLLACVLAWNKSPGAPVGSALARWDKENP